MYAADEIIDIGPGAGVHGGNIMAQGTAEEIKKVENSITGQYLSGRRKIEVPKTRRKAVKSKCIEVKGATEHNLKNIDVTIPRDEFIVITGLSGSGKSSLAFDTIYSEGQRRYMESLTSYARQFLGLMEKPDVERIDRFITSNIN